MSRISNKIRAYVADPIVSNHYGEWGALRTNQRRQIRELCDVCDMFEKTADKLFIENERLKKANESFADMGKMFSEIKAEAYKEFAEKAVEQVEKARQKYQRLCKEQGEEMEEYMHIHFNGITKIINNLLKETVGEDI